MSLYSLDLHLIRFFKKISGPLSRIGLFIVFGWFGILKIFNYSPATPLVKNLFEQTISFLPFSTFLILFGVLELLIGILFLIKGAERAAFLLLILHMITTFLPLFMLREVTWSGWFLPTLEGQYIIKNVVIIATAMGIVANLHPIRK